MRRTRKLKRILKRILTRTQCERTFSQRDWKEISKIVFRPNFFEIDRLFRLCGIELLSFWWKFHHWLHWKLSKWQLPVQLVMKISLKKQHIYFSVYLLLIYLLIYSPIGIHFQVFVITCGGGCFITKSMLFWCKYHRLFMKATKHTGRLFLCLIYLYYILMSLYNKLHAHKVF